MSATSRMLIFALVVFVVGGTGLWIIGGNKDECSTVVTINASPEQIFPFLTQPDLLTQWVGGLEHVETLIPNRDDGLPSRATRTPRIINQNGKRIRFEDEILRFDQDKMVSIQSSNAEKVITSIYLLEPQAGPTTQLQYRVKSSNVGVGRLIAPLQKNDLPSRIESDALRLKKLVEQQQKNLSPPSTLEDDSKSQSELSNAK